MSAHFVLGGRVQIDREEQRSLSSICFLSSSSSCPVCQAVPNFTGWTSKAHFSRRRPKLGHSFCYSSTVFLSSVRHSVSTCNVLSPSLVRHIFHGEDTSLVSLFHCKLKTITYLFLVFLVSEVEDTSLVSLSDFVSSSPSFCWQVAVDIIKCSGVSARFVLGGRVRIDREEQRSLSSICFLSSSSSCPVCQAVPNFYGLDE